MAVPALMLLPAACGEARADATRGEALYNNACVSCHGDKQTPPPVEGAPPHTVDGHTWHHGDRLLYELISGELAYPGRVMPAFQSLSRRDINDIIAYLKTWWGPEERAFQEEATLNELRR